ncbi:MAG TPA: hypothetical protein VGN37_00660 [Actinocatenispora sp.]
MRAVRIARWFACRLGRGGSALRRPSDRVEGIAALVALLVVLLAVPAGVLVGGHATDRAAASAKQQRTGTYRTTAVLLGDVPVVVGSDGTAGYGARLPVRASWPTRAGERTGQIDATPGLRRGARVPVWVDRSGAVVDPPAGSFQVTATGAATGLGVLIGAIAAVTLFYGGLRIGLDRRRFARWDREWRRFGPRGNRRVG